MAAFPYRASRHSQLDLIHLPSIFIELSRVFFIAGVQVISITGREYIFCKQFRKGKWGRRSFITHSSSLWKVTETRVEVSKVPEKDQVLVEPTLIRGDGRVEDQV